MTAGSGVASVLFTGYAPVHFVCFHPIFDALSRSPRYTVHVSGGLETSGPDGPVYDARGLYDRFRLPDGAVLDTVEIAERSFDLVFSASTRFIAPRESGRTIQIFHGLSFRNRAARAENAGYDAYFLLGPYQRKLFARLGIFAEDDSRLHSIGFPKTDRLVGDRVDRRATLRDLGLSGARPIVLYAPTGATGNSLETVGERLIRAIVAMGTVDLLVKPHDHPKSRLDWLSRLAAGEGDRMRIVRDADIVPSLALADVLVTDASSAANEFTLRDLPIVFIDVPELLERAQREDGRLDLDTWGRRGGIIVSTPGEAVAAIEASLESPSALSEIRRAMRDDLFYNQGSATQAALEWIGEASRG